MGVGHPTRKNTDNWDIECWRRALLGKPSGGGCLTAEQVCIIFSNLNLINSLLYSGVGVITKKKGRKEVKT